MALRFLAIAEQRSLFLSYVALLLSAVALTISISFSSAPPVAAQLRPELPPNYVRLEGLGTASLADRAVTAAKLADEAVTLRTLGTDALTEIASTVSRSEKLVGEVDEAGTTIRGHGFTSERLATGEYELTFDEAFLAPPVVLAVAQSYGVCYLPRQTIGTRSVRIKCMSDLIGSVPQVANTRFSFYAAPAI